MEIRQSQQTSQMDPDPIVISADAAKLLVAQHGVRGAARVLQLDQRATEAFRKRVQRAGWMRDPSVGQPAAIAAKEAMLRPIVAPVSPAQAHNEEMKRLGSETRLSVARTVQKGFAHAENQKPEEIIAQAQELKALGGLADMAHNWSNTGPTVKVSLAVTGAHQIATAEPESIEAEWSDCSDD
jgi:hypothetical protein